MPVEEESTASRQPDKEAKAESDAEDSSSEGETSRAAAHDIIIRHDMLIQRDDLQKYMQARPPTIHIQHVVMIPVHLLASGRGEDRSFV